MIPAWTEQDYVNYHYSRRAIAAIKREVGSSDLRHIFNLERKACRRAQDLMHTPPEVELTEQLLPVVIHDSVSGAGPGQ